MTTVFNFDFRITNCYDVWHYVCELWIQKKDASIEGAITDPQALIADDA